MSDLMSGYAYDYTLAPARPTGWRSVFTNILTVTAIVAVSAISGAVVALDLIAPQSRGAAAPAVVAAVPSRPDNAVVAVRAPAPVSVRAITDEPPRQAAMAVPAIPPPQAAPAAAIDDDASAVTQDSELTFARGYSLRRAAQQAARATETKTVQMAAAETQFGRGAVVVRPKPKPRDEDTFAQTFGAQDNRRTASRDAFGFFDRFDRNERPGRNQAMAFGDSNPARRRGYQAPQGGGGLFGGLF